MRNGFVAVLLIVFCASGITAQSGHFMGQKTVGPLVGISGSGQIVGGGFSYYLKSRMSLSLDVGSESIEIADIKQKSLFFDIGANLILIERGGKFYFLGKGGLVYSNDQVVEPKSLEQSANKKGMFGGIRAEYFVANSIFLHLEYVEKLYFDKVFGNSRRGVHFGVNIAF